MHGGRFNRKGLPALYLATDMATAMREVAHGFPTKLVDPLLIVSYTIDCEDIVDLTSERTRRSLKIPANALACAWLRLQEERKPVPSQQIADRLMEDGAAGMLVRSFAPGSTPENINLVLWRWSDEGPHQVRVHDPQHRLPKSGLPWKD